LKKIKQDFSFFKSKGFLMLIALFIFILIMSFFFGDSGIIEIIKAKNQIETLRKSVAELTIEKETLTKEVANLDKNPLALEKKAREKLWLMKKNEKVIVIVKDKDKDKKKKDTIPGTR